jgi:uncharacterized membrane protein
MHYRDIIESIGMAVDAGGVAVIVIGAAIAFAVAMVRLSRREIEVYRRLRVSLGRTILLGLELLVAGDIIRTVAATPTLTGVAVLAAIVGIRSFLSVSLEVEITGQWPWRRAAGPASGTDHGLTCGARGERTPLRPRLHKGNARPATAH